MENENLKSVISLLNDEEINKQVDILRNNTQDNDLCAFKIGVYLLRVIKDKKRTYKNDFKGQPYDEQILKLNSYEESVLYGLYSTDTFYAKRREAYLECLNNIQADKHNVNVDQIVAKAKEICSSNEKAKDIYLDIFGRNDYLAEMEDDLKRENSVAQMLDEMLDMLYKLQEKWGVSGKDINSHRLDKKIILQTDKDKIAVPAEFLNAQEQHQKMAIAKLDEDTRKALFEARQQPIPTKDMLVDKEDIPKARFANISRVLQQFTKLVIFKKYLLDDYKKDAASQKEAILENKSELKEKYYELYHTGRNSLLYLTKFVDHNNSQGAASVKATLETFYALIPKIYQYLKTKNSDSTWLEFLDTLDGICLEACCRNITDYCEKHPEISDIVVDDQREHPGIYVKKVPDLANCKSVYEVACNIVLQLTKDYQMGEKQFIWDEVKYEIAHYVAEHKYTDFDFTRKKEKELINDKSFEELKKQLEDNFVIKLPVENIRDNARNRHMTQLIDIEKYKKQRIEDKELEDAKCAEKGEVLSDERKKYYDDRMHEYEDEEKYHNMRIKVIDNFEKTGAIPKIVVPDENFQSDIRKAVSSEKLYPDGRISSMYDKDGKFVIKQRGDTCYFMAPILALIDKGMESFIRDNIVCEYEDDKTKARVRLFDEDGLPVDFIVSKTVFENDENSNKPMWIIMLEKAMCVLMNPNKFGNCSYFNMTSWRGVAARRVDWNEIEQRQLNKEECFHGQCFSTAHIRGGSESSASAMLFGKTCLNIDKIAMAPKISPQEKRIKLLKEYIAEEKLILASSGNKKIKTKLIANAKGKTNYKLEKNHIVYIKSIDSNKVRLIESIHGEHEIDAKQLADFSDIFVTDFPEESFKELAKNDQAANQNIATDNRMNVKIEDNQTEEEKNKIQNEDKGQNDERNEKKMYPDSSPKKMDNKDETKEKEKENQETDTKNEKAIAIDKEEEIKAKTEGTNNNENEIKEKKREKQKIEEIKSKEINNQKNEGGELSSEDEKNKETNNDNIDETPSDFKERLFTSGTEKMDKQQQDLLNIALDKNIGQNINPKGKEFNKKNRMEAKKTDGDVLNLLNKYDNADEFLKDKNFDVQKVDEYLANIKVGWGSWFKIFFNSFGVFIRNLFNKNFKFSVYAKLVVFYKNKKSIEKYDSVLLSSPNNLPFKESISQTRDDKTVPVKLRQISENNNNKNQINKV